MDGILDLSIIRTVGRKNRLIPWSNGLRDGNKTEEPSSDIPLNPDNMQELQSDTQNSEIGLDEAE